MWRGLWSPILVIGCASGCKSSHDDKILGVGGDGGVIGDGGGGDSGIGGQDLQFYGCGAQALTQYTFPDLHVGELAVANFRVASSATPAVTTTGSGLTASADMSAGIQIRFQPTAPGAFAGTVTVSDSQVGGSMRTGTITVACNVLPASPQPLAVSPTFVSMGSEATMLSNQMAGTTVSLESTTFTSDDDLQLYEGITYAAQGTLLYGDTSVISVERYPRTLGCHRTTKSYQANTNSVSTTIDDLTSAAVALTSVDASPAGACDGTSCVTSPITLTPTTQDGFIGWSARTGCGTEPSCVFRPVASSLMGTTYLSDSDIALFAPIASPTVTLTMNGSGKGRVIFSEDNGRELVCEGSCTYAPQSPTGVVRARVVSPAKFTGWGGFCTGTSSLCQFGPLSGNLAVTATFDAYDHEVSAFEPPVHDLYQSFARDVAFLPNGDVVFLAGNRLTRMTPAGATVWSHPTLAVVVATSSSGDIYTVATPNYPSPVTRVDKFDISGALVWRQWFSKPFPNPPYPSTRVAMLATGNVAVLDGDTVRVVSGSTGAEIWNSPAASALGLLAGNSTAVLALAFYDSATDTTRIERFDQTGARLTDWTNPGEVVGMAFASNDELILLSSTQTGEALTRLRTNGHPVWSITQTGEYAKMMALAPNDEIIVGDGPANGSRLQRYDGTGNVLWTLAPAPPFWNQIAVNTLGGFVVAGTDTVYVSTSGWGDVLVPWAKVFAR